MMRQALRVIDQLAPPDLRQNDLLFRARALIIGLLLVTGISLLLPVAMIWQPEPDTTFVRMFLPINLLMVATAVVSLLLFRRYGTFAVSTHLFAIVHTAAQLWLIMVTGGMRLSPVGFILGLQPLLTFVMGGRRIGALWAVITIALGISLGPVDGALIVPQASAETREFLRVSVWLVAVLVAYGCFWYLDQINRRLAAGISRERDVAQFAAAHDPLTGLLNRSAFSQRLEIAAHRAQFSGQPLALIYVDLDGFKPINDNFGHHAGDQLLATLAQRLRQTVRSSDTVARLGGDEFGLILEGASQATLERLLPEILQAMATPALVENREVQVSASIGTALLPGDAGDPEVLSRCADHAMYCAKTAGRNRFIFYRDTAA